VGDTVAHLTRADYADAFHTHDTFLDLFVTELGQLFVHLRDRLEQVCDQSVIGDLEDRCFFVLVDRGDDFRVLHASQMLNGT